HADHRGGGRDPRAAPAREARGGPGDGGQVGRPAPAGGRPRRAGRSHPAPGPSGDAQSPGGRGAGRDAGGGAGGHGGGRAAHSPHGSALRAGEGRSPQGRCDRPALERARLHALHRGPGGLHEHPRHRLHLLGRHHRGPRAGPGPRRRDPLRQGLRDPRDPRGLQGRPRGGPAPPLHPRLVMSDPEPIASETPEADDAGKMSFFDHLTELRTRIIWSLIPSAVGLAIAFYFTDRIMVFLQRPLANLKTPPIFLTPTEYFWTYMKVAMITGVFIAMPIILWNVWAFVAPGLHKH